MGRGERRGAGDADRVRLGCAFGRSGAPGVSGRGAGARRGGSDSRVRPRARCPGVCIPAATPGCAWPIWAGGERLVVQTGTAWVETADPEVMGYRPLHSCLVPGCGFGQHRYRLCYTHSHAWDKAGRPAVDRWKPDVAGTPAAVCAIPGCMLWAELDAGWCHSHHRRWRQRGRPSAAEFIAYCASYGEDRFDLRPLAPRLRLEIGYALQCRVDANRTRTTPRSIKPLLDHLSANGAESLLDRPLDDWLAGTARRRIDTPPRAFLGYAIECLLDLRDGTGWDSEYQRDVWRLRRLGVSAAMTVPGWISLRCNQSGCESWPNDGAGGACRAESGWGSCAKIASRWFVCRS